MTMFYSGGAAGADEEWCKAAHRWGGHSVIIVSFPGHHVVAPAHARVTCVPPERLKQCDALLTSTARALKRRVPRPGYVRNLLRRNVQIAQGVEAVYAVANIGADGGVAGGTAWVCASHAQHSKEPCLFVFDMAADRWVARFERDAPWRHIDGPPMFTAFCSVALVGNRALTASGKRAIDDIFRKSARRESIANQ